MAEVQSYLQDLLRIDCDIQTNLQNLVLVTAREGLEAKSKEIKKGLKEFKEKLKELKEFCDIYSKNETGGFISRFNRSDDIDYYSSTTSSSSPKEILVNELQIQREHLLTVESRFRNAYLVVQVISFKLLHDSKAFLKHFFISKAKLDQIERNNLIDSERTVDSKEVAAKKRNINQQMILKKSNELTSKLSDINRQLKWTEHQTTDTVACLDESSKIIRNTQQEYGFMKNVISDGKRLLVRLSRREFTDKLLIVLCLCFFFSVVFYIVWKRAF